MITKCKDKTFWNEMHWALASCTSSPMKPKSSRTNRWQLLTAWSSNAAVSFGDRSSEIRLDFSLRLSSWWKHMNIHIYIYEYHESIASHILLRKYFNSFCRFNCFNLYSIRLPWSLASLRKSCSSSKSSLMFRCPRLEPRSFKASSTICIYM